MPFTPDLLDQLLKDYKTPDDLLGHDGLLQQLTKALVERALEGELTHPCRLRKACSGRQKHRQLQKRHIFKDSSLKAPTTSDRGPA